MDGLIDTKMLRKRMNLSFMNYFSCVLIKIFFFRTKDLSSKKCAHYNTTLFYCKNFYFENFFQYWDLNLSVDTKPHGVKNGEIPRIRQILPSQYDNANQQFEYQIWLTWYAKMVINQQKPMRIKQLVWYGVL